MLLIHESWIPRFHGLRHAIGGASSVLCCAAFRRLPAVRSIFPPVPAFRPGAARPHRRFNDRRRRPACREPRRKCLACHRRAPCRAIHEPAHPADTGSPECLGPLAIDFYLPSFPTLAKAFATDVEHVQLSLAAPTSPACPSAAALRPGGRPLWPAPAALGGGEYLHPGLRPPRPGAEPEWLIAARFVQAPGGCAGMVISRAVVRDLCDPGSAPPKAFSQLMLVMGLAPILAPVARRPAVGLAGLAIDLRLPDPVRRPGRPRRGVVAAGNHPGRIGERPPLSGALGAVPAVVRRPPVSRLWPFRRGGDGRDVRLHRRFAYVFIQLYGIPAEHYGWLFGSNAAGFIVMAQVNASGCCALSRAGVLAAADHLGLPGVRPVPAGIASLQPAIAVAAAGSAVRMRGQPRLHHSQRFRLRHGRTGTVSPAAPRR